MLRIHYFCQFIKLHDFGEIEDPYIATPVRIRVTFQYQRSIESHSLFHYLSFLLAKAIDIREFKSASTFKTIFCPCKTIFWGFQNNSKTGNWLYLRYCQKIKISFGIVHQLSLITTAKHKFNIIMFARLSALKLCFFKYFIWVVVASQFM